MKCGLGFGVVFVFAVLIELIHADGGWDNNQ